MVMVLMVLICVIWEIFIVDFLILEGWGLV